MTHTYYLKWTSWRVWLHPHRARCRIEESEEVENDLRRRLEETLALLEHQRKETSVLSIRVAETSGQLADSEKKRSEQYRLLEETRLELRKAQDALAEHKSVDEKLREFDRELDKIEEMKRNYEKRITELEARLGDARKRLAAADDNELLEPIDMTDGQRTVKSRNKSASQPARPDGYSPSSWSSQPSKPQPASQASQETRPATESQTSDKSGSSVSAGVRPVIEEKDTRKIEGTPAETASQVADYLSSMQKKRADHPDDDWLSELPEL